MTVSQHWGIVGGGILGLRLAQQLQKSGHHVTVMEAAPTLGGLAAAWQLGPVTWDRHYHVILLSDHNVQALLQDLGLQDEFVGSETKTGFYTDGQLYSMSNSLEFLKFPPLGMLSKLRLAATIMRASRIKDWRQLEQISVEDWLTKWSGKRTFDKIWRPLLRSKLGESYKQASAAFIWAIIARMYAARRSGLKKEIFGYVRGGYARIIARYAELLEERGVELLTDCKVARIEATDNGVTVHRADELPLQFDQVVVTTTTPLASKLLPDLEEFERQRLNDVPYQGIVCASMLLNNPLDRYYVTNITDEWVPFTAVIEMTTLVDVNEFDGKHLVYLPRYVAPIDPLFDESDESIRERFLSAIEQMYPHFSRADVLAFQVSRVRNVFAVMTKNYSAMIPSQSTSMPGVHLVNSAQIVNGTLNVNETLQLANDSISELLTAPQNTLSTSR